MPKRKGGGKLLVASEYKAAVATSNDSVYDRNLQRNVSYTAVGWLNGYLRPGWTGGCGRTVLERGKNAHSVCA
jgi:hypothetical protein